MDPPGRFLIKNAGKWKEINDKAAMAKTRQALREGAKDILVNGEQRPSSIGSEADFSSMVSNEKCRSCTLSKQDKFLQAILLPVCR